MEAWVIIQFLVALAMGLVGSFFDNERHDYEVPNKVWLVFGIGGFIVAGFRWLWLPIFVLIHLFFAGILSGGILVAYRLGKGAIGGADVKAIMALSVTLGLWSFLCLLFAVVVLSVYALVIGGYKGNLKKMKAPFLPFLWVGILGGFVVFMLGI